MAPPQPPQMSPMDYFWAAPPFSRTLTALTLGISILVYTGILPGYLVVFYIPFILKIPPQIWRLFTCFLLSGPKLGIVFDPYFLYMYGSRLETASPRFSKPADFYMYIIFIWATILGLNIIFTGATVLTSALILAFTYTACQDDRLSKAMFFVVTIPATWIPLAMLFLTFVMAGPEATTIQATGLVAAHLHDFLTNIYPTFGGGANILQTPAFVERFFAVSVPRIIQRAYGTAIINPQQQSGGLSGTASTGASSATSGSVLPESWRSRGPGHRLGGD